MRDQIKSKEYFENFILEDLERIHKFSCKLENGEVKPDRIFAVKAKMHDLKLGIIIAKYSKGEKLDILREEYLELIKEWKEVWQEDYYNKALKMISLGVLFDVGKDILDVIELMLKGSNINDWLFDFLLKGSEDKTIEKEKQLLFPEAFSTLKQAVYAENAIDLLKKYLKKEWYNKDCGCYEAHKSEQNIYYGYWSFEAGAVVKLLQVNDEELRDIQYYPYDLAHFNNAKK